MPTFAAIPKFMHGGSYTADVPLGYLEQWLGSQGQPVDTDPDFQRGHVWTIEQRSRYMEFLIRGGTTSRTLYWNHPTYVTASAPGCNLPETLVLVDGKQRLTSALMFLRNEVPVLGHFLREYTDPARVLGISGCRFTMQINNLATRADLLQWYIDLNDGGTVHAASEIARVRGLLEQCK